MRLFEATGCGALLVTDRGRNLSQYFAEDEVLAYSTPEEAAQLITWAQRCPDEAASMSRKAQERTVREHSYSSRMSDLDQILRTHLGAT
jgi:spore maturation protein CgeB